MGRASRKESSSAEPREHWSETHPDRHLWTEAQLVHARMQTQAEYEALYGRGGPVAPAADYLEHPDGFVLLRERGQYGSAEEAASSGDDLPLLDASSDLLRITSLALRDGELNSFALNEYQMQHFLGLAEEHFPGRDDLPLEKIWEEGGDLFGNRDQVAGAFQYPHVGTIIKEAVSDLEDGERVALDNGGSIQVERKDDQFIFISNGQEALFDSIADVTDRALVQGQGNGLLFSPRRLRGSDTFAPLFLVAERGENRLWVNREGHFILDTSNDQTMVGWVRPEETIVSLKSSVELSPDASNLLVQFFLSSGKRSR